MPVLTVCRTDCPRTPSVCSLKRWKGWAFFAILWSCHAGPTMPDGDPLPMAFSSTRIYTPVLPPVFEVSPQSIRITGVVSVNVPCYDFAGLAALRRDTVDVVVRAIPQAGRVCQQVLAAYQFTANITTIPSGPHTVILRYKDEGFAYERLVATTNVVVP